jgi:hypothetical protein
MISKLRLENNTTIYFHKKEKNKAHTSKNPFNKNNHI